MLTHHGIGVATKGRRVLLQKNGRFVQRRILSRGWWAVQIIPPALRCFTT
jgi:hypothetical protein